MLNSFQSWYRGLPDKKRYLEFISAFLSIPVLVTVAVLNLRSLQARNEPTQAVPASPAPTQIVIREIIVPASPGPSATPTSTPTATATPSPTPTPTLVPTPTGESTSSATMP